MESVFFFFYTDIKFLGISSSDTVIRGGSRTAATSKMEHFEIIVNGLEHFEIIVNGWKPLTIITKSSILDVAAFLDLPL